LVRIGNVGFTRIISFCILTLSYCVILSHLWEYFGIFVCRLYRMNCIVMEKNNKKKFNRYILKVHRHENLYLGLYHPKPVLCEVVLNRHGYSSMIRVFYVYMVPKIWNKLSIGNNIWMKYEMQHIMWYKCGRAKLRIRRVKGTASWDFRVRGFHQTAPLISSIDRFIFLQIHGFVFKWLYRITTLCKFFMLSPISRKKVPKNMQNN